MAVFSVQDAQSQRFLSVENSPAPLCSISMGGKGGGYTYYIGNSLRQSLTALPAPSEREPLAKPGTLQFNREVGTIGNALCA